MATINTHQIFSDSDSPQNPAATTKNLSKMSVELIPVDPNTKIKDINIHQDLSGLYEVLQFIVDLWIEEKTKRDEFSNPRHEIAGLVAVMLECISKAGRGKFELVYDKDPNDRYLGSINIKEKASSPTIVENILDSPVCSSPDIPTTIPDSHKSADSTDSTDASAGRSYTPPRLLNLRVQSLEKLGSKDLNQMASNIKHNPKAMENSNAQIPIGVPSITPPQPLSIAVSGPTPPRPLPPPPQPLSIAVSGPPPPRPLPPPPMVGKAKGGVASKSTTKLKRSAQMAKVYRLLRGIFEGSNCLPGGKGKLSAGTKKSSNGGKSLADALKEMTKSSPYYKKIEEDVKKHGKAIDELGVGLSAFETTDIEELLKFHRSVVSQLGVLSDENNVLKMFKSFPIEKLETLRSAAAPALRMELMVLEMQNQKAVIPLVDSLDRVEKYFDKTKMLLSGIEVEINKKETLEILKLHKIQVDYSNALTKVKESMVDLSSGYIELALKSRREARANTNDALWLKAGGKQVMSAKMLWRAFQFAYKVYSFVGGQDERAETLTAEVAKELESIPSASTPTIPTHRIPAKSV